MVKNQEIVGFKFDSDRMILKEVDFEEDEWRHDNQYKIENL